MIMQYSADNDLDIFKLSAQMSVLSKEKIGSVGELEGRIAYVKADYESQRAELNAIIEEHNRFSTLFKQADTYYALSKRDTLAEAAQLQKECIQESYGERQYPVRADHDQLRNKVESLDKKISARRRSSMKLKRSMTCTAIY